MTPPVPDSAFPRFRSTRERLANSSARGLATAAVLAAFLVFSPRVSASNRSSDHRTAGVTLAASVDPPPPADPSGETPASPDGKAPPPSGVPGKRVIIGGGGQAPGSGLGFGGSDGTAEASTDEAMIEALTKARADGEAALATKDPAKIGPALDAALKVQVRSLGHWARRISDERGRLEQEARRVAATPSGDPSRGAFTTSTRAVERSFRDLLAASVALHRQFIAKVSDEGGIWSKVSVASLDYPKAVAGLVAVVKVLPGSAAYEFKGDESDPKEYVERVRRLFEEASRRWNDQLDAWRADASPSKRRPSQGSDRGGKP